MLRAPSYFTVRKTLDWCIMVTCESRVMVTCESLDVDIAGRVCGNIPQVVASRSFTLDEWCIMNKEAERVNAMRGVEP